MQLTKKTTLVTCVTEQGVIQNKEHRGRIFTKYSQLFVTRTKAGILNIFDNYVESLREQSKDAFIEQRAWGMNTAYYNFDMACSVKQQE